MSKKLDEQIDSLIDDLWGRALDMTSPDFANDDDYLKAKTNYHNYSKTALNHLIAEQVVAGQLYINEGYLQLFLGLQEYAIRPAFEEFASQLVDHANAKKEELEAHLKDKQGK